MVEGWSLSELYLKKKRLKVKTDFRDFDLLYLKTRIRDFLRQRLELQNRGYTSFQRIISHSEVTPFLP